MQGRRFYVKLAFIVFLMVFLLVPQAFIFGMVSERAGWREQAYQSIGQSWPGEQTFAGPLLVLPYQLTRTVKEKVKDADGTEREISRDTLSQERLLLMPKQLNITSKLDSTLRYRGIYAVPVYSSTLQIKGQFDQQQLTDLLSGYQNPNLQWGKPYLAVMVRDQRGIVSPPTLQWAGNKVAFAPGSDLPGNRVDAGMHAVLPAMNPHELGEMAFNFDMSLNGMRGMNFALLSEDTQIQQAANWSSPSFTGEILPTERNVTEGSFTAQWRASSFSINVQDALTQCRTGDCSNLTLRTVGFNLIQPVDVYQQAERSVKYALLFIVLTFGVLVLFELLKQLRIHPVQYTLVGFALLVFYLLLISLSEHVTFALAYGVAGLASASLLTLYFGAILHSRKLGLLLGAGLAGLYGLLYVILQAEENALLMGSILIFAVLAVLMLTTRHFDWYALMGNTSTDTPSAASAQNLQKTSAVSP